MASSLRELGAALGKRFRTSLPSSSSIELGAVVSCDGVDYEQSDVVLLNSNGDLIAEDVFLCFEIVNMSAVNLAQRRAFFNRQLGQFRMRLQNLCKSRGLEWCFCRYVQCGCAMLWLLIIFCSKLPSEKESQEKLGLASSTEGNGQKERDLHGRAEHRLTSRLQPLSNGHAQCPRQALRPRRRLECLWQSIGR